MEMHLWGKTYFHMNGLARCLVFTLRQKTTREWLIDIMLSCAPAFHTDCTYEGIVRNMPRRKAKSNSEMAN